MILYSVEILENCKWFEIGEYTNLTKEEVYMALKTISEDSEYCTRILCNDKVVCFIQTNDEQIEWLINQDLDRLANNRVLKYMSDYNGGKKR